MANDMKAELNKEKIQAGQTVDMVDSREEKESMKAAQEGRIASSQVERVMTSEEVLLKARENGIYINMLAPCLAANISLDAMILPYFNEPMKEIDLEDKIKDVMNVIVADISKDQNGLVFHPDGSLDVRESLKQSASAGIPATALLIGGMDENALDNLMQKYSNETQLAMLSSVSNQKNFSMEDTFNIFSKSVESYKNVLDAHNYYHYIFDADSYTQEEKDKIYKEKDKLKKDLEITRKAIKEKSKELEGLEKNSEAWRKCKLEIRDLAIQANEKREQIAMLGNPEDDTKEEIDAKVKVAKVCIAGALGVSKNHIDELGNDMRNAKNEYTEEAIANERVARIVQKNIMKDFAEKDISRLKYFQDEVGIDNLNPKEKNEYLILALKSYFSYTQLQGKLGARIIDPELSKQIVGKAMAGLELIAPTIKRNRNGTIDFSSIIGDIRKIPGYENVSKENIKQVFIDKRSEEIENRLEEVSKYAEHDMLRYDEIDMSEYVENLSIGNKEEFYANAVNYMKALQERGIESNMTSIIIRRLEIEGYDNISTLAAEKYELEKASLSGIIDNFIVDNGLKKCSKFKMFEHENKLENLNPEEKAKILSGVIAAHKILESNEGVREEVREDLDEVIGFFMPNVFDENGKIDDNKLIEEYNKLNLNSRFLEDGSEKAIKNFYEYHEMYAAQNIQQAFTMKILDRIKEDKIAERPIEEEEAKKVVEERGEELDNSAIINPKQNKNVERQVTEAEAKKAVNERGEELIVANENEKIAENEQENEEVKTAQTFSEINVGTEGKETSLISQIKVGIFTKIFKTIKEKLSSMFSKNRNDETTTTTSNDTDVANSGDGSNTIDNSESVKNITGYDPIKLQFNNQEKIAEDGENKDIVQDEAARDENDDLEI